MKQFCTYFTLELKRTLRMLPWFFGSILLLMALIFAGTFVISKVLQKGQVFQPIHVDLVIDQEEDEVKLIASVLSTMESVKSICKFTPATEEEARQNIRNGESQAAIIIGSNFYEEMDAGENPPAVILMSKETSLHLEVFRELITDGVSLIQTTEGAIFAVMDAGKEYKMKMSRSEMANFIFYCYVEAAFSRGDIFQNSMLSPIGEYDMTQYYFVSGLLMCFMMCGLNFGFLYGKSQQVVEEKLKVSGLGSLKVSIAKLLVMGLSLWAIGMILLGIVEMICAFTESSLFIFDKITVLGLGLISFSIAALFHVVYTFGRTSGGLLLFFINAGMLLCSGVIWPASYLPEVVGNISKVLPLSYWQKHTMEFMYSQPKTEAYIIQLAIILAGILLGALKGRKVWKKG